MSQWKEQRAAALSHELVNPHGEAKVLRVKVTNPGTTLTTFTIGVKTDASDTAETIKSTTADFTVPSGRLLTCSGDLTGLTSSTPMSFDLAVNGLHSVVLTADSGKTVSLRCNWQ